MKRWKRTSLLWNFEPEARTVIPVTDNECLDQKAFHSLRSIDAVSYPHREGIIQFEIFRCGVGPTTEKAQISNALFRGVEEATGRYGAVQHGVHTDDRLPHVFEINFVLRDKVQFCDFALETVRYSLHRLLPKVTPEIVGRFTLSSMLFIEFPSKAAGIDGVGKNMWTPYDNQLRISHGLPARRLFVPQRKNPNRMVLVV